MTKENPLKLVINETLVSRLTKFLDKINPTHSKSWWSFTHTNKEAAQALVGIMYGIGFQITFRHIFQKAIVIIQPPTAPPENCKQYLLLYYKSVQEINDKNNAVNNNQQQISAKWREHDTYWPRPWPSYRSQFRKEIEHLNNKNQKLEQTDIPAAKRQVEEQLAAMNECLNRKTKISKK